MSPKNFYDSFKNAGFSINDTLYSAYEAYTRRANNQDIKRSASDIGEADPAFYDQPNTPERRFIKAARPAIE